MNKEILDLVEKILEIREKKAEKNGKFSKKIILEKVFNMEK